MEDSKTFDGLGLDTELLAAIADLGFTVPTPVQEVVIPRLLTSRRDLVGLAQTGTGKTAAFGLPVIQQTDVTGRDTQVLILCPTRELCLQIAKDFGGFCTHKKGLRVLAAYGGSPIHKQIAMLNRGAHVLVATPGRLNDLLRRKKAHLEHVQRVVLDEADEMLNMGFQEDLETILKQVPDTVQTLLFSATMPRQVAAIAGKYMNDPEEISIGARNAGAENVTHVCYTVHAKDRYLALKRIADFYPDMYGIVFCRTRVETQVVADKLVKDGYNAGSLHGDLTQVQRDHVMAKLRARNLQMLVATDVAARGLDVNDLTHIINYDLPDDLGGYIHRSGRTGRAGKAGMSVVIVHMREKGRINRIEQIIKKRFEFRKIPSGREVCESQLLALIKRVKDVEVDHGQIGPYLSRIEPLLEGMSRDELIKHFVSLELNRFLAYYRDAPDLNVRSERRARSERAERPERRERQRAERPSGDSGLVRLSMSLGRKDLLSPKRLIGLVNDAMPGQTVEIGQIEILNTSCVFEVDRAVARKVIHAFSVGDHAGRGIRIGPAVPSRERRQAKRKPRR